MSGQCLSLRTSWGPLGPPPRPGGGLLAAVQPAGPGLSPRTSGNDQWTVKALSQVPAPLLTSRVTRAGHFLLRASGSSFTDNSYYHLPPRVAVRPNEIIHIRGNMFSL